MATVGVKGLIQPPLQRATNNQATTPFGYCPSTAFLPVQQMPDETDAKKILTASPLENWRRPPERPRTTWLKTNQQDLKSNNLSLNEAI